MLASLFATLTEGPFWIVTGAAFGLAVGSFANVCIYRIPRAIDEVWTLRAAGDSIGPLRAARMTLAALDNPRRSRCPLCGADILLRDNLPLLGWLLLRGRCRSCQGPISWRYPAVEAANGTGWGLVAATWGPSLQSVLLMLLLTALLVLSLIDLDHQILPDVITLPGTAVGLLASLLYRPPAFLVPLAPFWYGSAAWLGAHLHLPATVGSPSRAIVVPVSLGHLLYAASSAAGGYLALYAVARAYEKTRGVEGLGQGDWKMVAMLGAFFGWEKMLLTVFVATLVASVVGLALMAFAGRTARHRLPLGTFLGAAGILVLFVGDPMLEWYRGFFRG